MAKGYWVALYRSVSNPGALREYAPLADAAIRAGGGRFLSRGVAVKAFEAGATERSVLIEFDSVEAAIATYEGNAYQAALRLLEDAVERDVRILAAAE